MGEIFVNCIPDKGHTVCIIYKEHLHSSTTKRQTQFKKRKMDSSRHFSEEEIQMANDYMKMLGVFSH